MRIEMVLLLEEGRIEVLRSVAEEVERRHQHHEVERDLPVACELHERLPPAACPTPRLEHRAFLDVNSNEQDEQRGCDADHEHAAPANRVEQQIIDEARYKVARGIAALQQAGHGPPKLRRDGFHDQARAEAPLAAHCDSKQEAQHE